MVVMGAMLDMALMDVITDTEHIHTLRTITRHMDTRAIADIMGVIKVFEL